MSTGTGDPRHETDRAGEEAEPGGNGPDENDPKLPVEAPDDVAERPGSGAVGHEHADDLANEWGEESFPASDPPAHY
ncbi:hypothetical protein MUN77_00165 [Leucobacter allii]|uniref:hypothetical protein n=1 Tax=Leucobacter allii TaxID=2932247 RepID=UPI001FD3FB4B|nr:hypothetical protein [Leucobacter allii]UOR01779.1 hypothetical protein MUN77_00165 [Leucobacter allii]